jgi:L-2,4-diaminobutyrate decarboxylase
LKEFFVENVGSASSAASSETGINRSQSLLDAFDPHLFGENSKTAVARLEAYLAEPSIRGLELTDPAILSKEARALMIAGGGHATFDEKRLAAILDLYIRTGIQVHSPGSMGRQFSGVIPLAGIIDFASSVVNQPSSFYEAAQLPNVVERIMADELNQFIGWDQKSFAMVTTSGGSLANLTALLAARNREFPEIWEYGGSALGNAGRPAIAMGEEAHYSVWRAAGVMGIGQAQIVRLPVNRNQQICPEQARSALAAAERRDLKVFCLVASAGTTSIGAFDPIDELADLARERNIWLHVDGAHGASLLVSDKLRGKLKGIEKADSLTWNAHKMMFVPSPCTMLFYRNKEYSLGAFRQHASYVFDEEPDAYSELDSGGKTFECTKRPMIMPLWTLWAMYGRSLFAEQIDYLCQLTQQAHQVILADPDFEDLHRPEANILCFRYRPADLNVENIHQFQLAIRNRIKLHGNFFISKVNIDGIAALRVVMMNHQTSVEHFRMLLDEIRETGRALLFAEEINERRAED